MHIEGDLGWADLFPDSGVACVFLPEAEVINPTTCVKEKLAAMAKVLHVHTMPVGSLLCWEISIKD